MQTGKFIETRQVLVDVPADQLKDFMQYVKRKHYEVLVTNDLDISEAHKALVRERRANSKPENLLDWDSLKDSFKLD